MRNLFKHALVVIAALVVLQTAHAEKISDAEFIELTKSLQQELNQIRAQQGFPGATAAVFLESGRLIKLATGMADVERGIVMTPDHRMLGGSSGKTYAAAVALALEEEGVWDLDDKVSKYLGGKPYWKGIANHDTITLRQLLQHRSGVQNYYDQARFHKLVEEKRAAGGGIDSFSREELIGFVDGIPQLFVPGKGYRYTDIGYILAGEAIEAVTGENYFDVLKEKLLVPLGLNLTDPTARIMPGLAQGYAPEPGPLIPGVTHMVQDNGEYVIDPTLEFTGGGLVNNPGDMVRWIQALYTGRAISKEAAAAILAKPAYPTEREQASGNYYGLGVFVKDHPSGGKSWGHGGYAPGYRSEMQYLPRYGFSTAVQVNTEVGFWDKPEPATGERKILLRRRADIAKVIRERLQAVVIRALENASSSTNPTTRGL